MRPGRLICGGLRRQRDTALGLLRTCERDPEIDPRWDEYASADVVVAHGPAAGEAAATDHGIGAGPGMSSADFQRLLDEALLGWIGAGEDTPAEESWPRFAGRGRAALTELAGTMRSGQDVLVVSSGGTIAAVIADLLGAPAATFVALNRMAINTGVSKLMVGRSGVNLLSYNDHTHLAGDRDLLTFR